MESLPSFGGMTQYCQDAAAYSVCVSQLESKLLCKDHQSVMYAGKALVVEGVVGWIYSICIKLVEDFNGSGMIAQLPYVTMLRSRVGA